MSLHANGRCITHPTDLLPMPCYVCQQPAAAVVIFVPYDDETRTVVQTLRRIPLVVDREPCVAYGLCDQHVPTTAQDQSALADFVENKLRAEANELVRRAS